MCDGVMTGFIKVALREMGRIIALRACSGVACIAIVSNMDDVT